MASNLTEDDYNNIIQLKKLLLEKYSSLIEKILCYGSRVYAQKSDADFDILVITHRKIDWKEERLIFRDIFQFGLERDIQFDPKFFSSDEINHTYKQMPFLKDVFSYGISI